jgi:hypothetical protein
MRTLALMFVLAALAAAALPGAGGARTQTTAPGYNFKIGVSITKGGHVVLSRSVAKRGWLAHFVITNKDSKAHRFDVGGLPVKKPIAPGATAKLGSYLEDRGAFKIHVDGVFRGYFNVV